MLEVYGNASRGSRGHRLRQGGPLTPPTGFGDLLGWSGHLAVSVNTRRRRVAGGITERRQGWPVG